MFVKTKQDFTQMAARLTGAPDVSGEAEYPGNPYVNDCVHDTELDVVKSWDGQRWVTLATRTGVTQQ